MSSLAWLRYLVWLLIVPLALAGCNDDDDENTVTVADVAFEQLAVQSAAGIQGLAIENKALRVETVLDAIEDATAGLDGVDVVYGMNGNGSIGDFSALVPFPGIDTDADGTADEIGRMIEIRRSGDEAFLASNPGYGIAMPWQIAAYTDTANDRIIVTATVPETALRVFFRGEANQQQLLARAEANRLMLESLVADALEPLGFTITNSVLAESPVLDEAAISSLEEQLGTLNLDFAAPSVTLTDGQRVETVVAALEQTFAAEQLADLNGDGVVNAADAAVFPAAMQQFLQGQMTFAQLQGMLGQGNALWSNGFTFQEWEHIRTLNLPGSDGDFYTLELCQRYYAGMALSFGLYHMNAMPCAVGVWEDEAGVHVSILDPRFIFGYWFSDVELAANDPMAQVFGIFPTFVMNEMIGVVNAGLDSLGVPADEQFALQEF